MEQVPHQIEQQESPDAPPGTLGEVLYPGKSARRDTEKEWAALVRSVAVGDQLALHALYERAHRPVFTLIMRIAGDPATAEELTLDVFHDVWRRAARYDAANGTVLGWIMNQARSRAIDRLRFENRKKRKGNADDEPFADAEVPDAQEILALKQRGQALRNAMSVLTRDELVVVEAAFFAGLTYSQVAERMQLPLGTVKTRIRSGLQKLRQAMAGGHS